MGDSEHTHATLNLTNAENQQDIAFVLFIQTMPFCVCVCLQMD